MSDHEDSENELTETGTSARSLGLPESEDPIYGRFIMAALGSIPWVGGVIAGMAAFGAEKEQGQTNQSIQLWLQEHDAKLSALYKAVSAIANGVDRLGEDAKSRIQEEEYLGLVRKGFKVWDRSDTDDKRLLVQCLLSNAAGTSVSHDDVVRLFLDWIDRYHEAHFQIIRAIYKNPGITLLGMWRETGNTGEIPRENSSAADLYRMLIHDLGTGRVLRQERQTNHLGQFMKKERAKRGSGVPASSVMKSSFDDTDRYELSELGQEFVHYVLQDVVSRIGGE